MLRFVFTSTYPDEHCRETEGEVAEDGESAATMVGHGLPLHIVHRQAKIVSTFLNHNPRTLKSNSPAIFLYKEFAAKYPLRNIIPRWPESNSATADVHSLI